MAQTLSIFNKTFSNVTGFTATNTNGSTVTYIDTSDANATTNDMLSGKTAYVDGQKITGNISSKSSSDLTASDATVTAPAGYYSTAATKTIDSGSTTLNTPIITSTGVVIATATVTAGYQAASTERKIMQLDTQAVQTITPGTTNQIIAEGKYLIGAQTIVGDANLIASNIRRGISIFNVTGTLNSVTLANNEDFYITVPNGTEDTITFHFVVDENGNTTIN